MRQQKKNIIIKKNFKIPISEQINYILEIEVKNIYNKYIISKENYINKNLENLKFKKYKKKKRYTNVQVKNIKSENNKSFNRIFYKSAIGMLIYLSKCTKPDISFAVHKATRNLENRTITDWIIILIY